MDDWKTIKRLFVALFVLVWLVSMVLRLLHAHSVK